jgi:hypothetical protein
MVFKGTLEILLKAKKKEKRKILKAFRKASSYLSVGSCIRPVPR